MVPQAAPEKGRVASASSARGESAAPDLGKPLARANGRKGFPGRFVR
jgi:hypothetical protein